MKRTKLVASMLACLMCLSVLCVGVYAAVNVGFSFNSQLTFNPEGVYVDISGQMYRGTNYALLSPLSGEGYSFTGNNYDIIDGEPAGNTAISWENIPSVTLVPGNRTVKYRIEVTNMSEESIQGTASPSISGTIGSGNTSTVGGVTTFSIFNKSNIENRDFAEGECEYSPSDYVTSAISDQPVWLPTYTDYSSKFNFENTETLRTCAPTDFAIVNEVGLASGNPTTLRVDNVACPYYTSTGNPAERVYMVTVNGNLDGGVYNVYSSAYGCLGIRPAIYYYI